MSNPMVVKILFCIIIPILFILLIYKILKIRIGLKSNLLEKSTEAITQNKEYQIYLLFLGVILTIIAII